MADFVESLGPGFFAHRLVRLSERMVESCGDWFDAVGVKAPPRAASTLLLLRARGPMSPPDIAEALQFTTARMTIFIRDLVRAGLVRIETDKTARGDRVAVLTAAGRTEAERIAGVNRMMASAYERLFREAGVDGVAAIDRLERALASQPLEDRLKAITEGRAE